MAGARGTAEENANERKEVALLSSELASLCKALRRASVASGNTRAHTTEKGEQKKDADNDASLASALEHATSARKALLAHDTNHSRAERNVFAVRAALDALRAHDSVSTVTVSALTCVDSALNARALDPAQLGNCSELDLQTLAGVLDETVSTLHDWAFPQSGIPHPPSSDAAAHAPDDAIAVRISSCLHAACSGSNANLLSSESFTSAARACFSLAHRTGRETPLLQQWCNSSLIAIARSAAWASKISAQLVDLIASVSNIDRGEEIAALGLKVANALLEAIPEPFWAGDSQCQHAMHCAVEKLCRSACRIGSKCKSAEALLRASCVMQQLYACRRHQLKLELQAWLLGVLVPKAEGKWVQNAEQQRTALEAVVDLCRMPSFAPEIYANYDCDIGSPNILEDYVLALLSRSAFPVSAQITPMHLLSMEGITCVVRGVSERCCYLEYCSSAIATQGILSDPDEYTDYWTDSPDAIIERSDAESAAVLLRRTKHLKRRLLSGADHFNRSQKHGIEFLQANKLLPTPADPDALARFLRHTPNVNKSAAGALLGEPGELEEGTLSAYVQQMDLRGMNLEQALRLFLSGFVLPGEAQKISRILEHFADAFVKQNPGEAADADSAYVLSYSIIMLNTDLHSPKVKGKMTLEEFIRNNRGMNGGEDFPRELLENIYNSILHSEIRIEGDSTEQQASEAFEIYWTDKERLARSHGRKTSSLLPLSNHVGKAIMDADLLSALWGPAIASISVVFDHSDDWTVLEEALNGFAAIAHAAGQHKQHSVLDSLVASLCRFAPLLSANSSASLGADPKARMAAEAAFSVAHKHGSSLRSGWVNVIDCMFRFHSCRLLPQNFPESAENDSASASGRPSNGSNDRGLHRQNSRSRAALTTRSILRNLSNGVNAILSIDAENQPISYAAGGKTNANEHVVQNDAKRYFHYEDSSSPNEIRVEVNGRDRQERTEEAQSIHDSSVDETAEETNERLAAACVKRCKPGVIIAESWRLDIESLEELVAAVASISEPSSTKQRDSSATAFSVRVLGVLAATNPERSDVIINRMYPLAESVLKGASRLHEGVEAAALQLLRVNKRVLPHLQRGEPAAQRVLGCLRLLFLLEPQIAQTLMSRFTHELQSLVYRARDKIDSSSWDAPCRLLGVTATHQTSPEHKSTAECGFETIKYICYGDADAGYTGGENEQRNLSLPSGAFSPVLRACVSHATAASLPMSHARASVSLMQQVSETSEDKAMWKEAVKFLKQVAQHDERDEVRSDAILALQRVSLLGLNFDATAEEWRQLIEIELMGLAVELCHSHGADSAARKAVSTACKVAVHSLDTARSGSLLQQTWETLTHSAEKCLQSNSSEEVAESAAESLRNVLNVMQAKGILNKELARSLTSTLSSCKRLTSSTDLQVPDVEQDSTAER